MGNPYAVFAWLALAFAFAAVTVRRRSLSPGGAITAVALGGAVIAGAGPVWILPLLVFFLSSTALGRFLPATGAVADAKDRQPRDAVQVLCNGGVFGLLAMAGLDPRLLLVTAAVATADTWASEIGKYFRQPTFDILRLRRVPPGLSGGVSTSGTMAGAAGAALIATLGWALVPGYLAADFAWVTALGFGGMLLDSVLGAGVQARYRSPEGGLSDLPLPGSVLAAGLPWMTNDLVNLLAIAATAAGAAGLLLG